MKTKDLLSICILSIASVFGMSSCGKFTTKGVPYYNYDPYDYTFRFSSKYNPDPASHFNAGTNELSDPPLSIFENRDNSIEYWNKRIRILEKERRWRRHEPRYIKNCTKWLTMFYADLYASGGNMQAFSEKYAQNIDSVLRPTLAAAYEKANNGAGGLDWALFAFSLKNPAEAQQLKISYSKNHWFNVQLPGKDTLILKVRIEDDRPQPLINGLLKPKQNIIMTPLCRMKAHALVELYHDMGELTNKDFTDKYAASFEPEILDTLRYGDRDGYDWDKLKIGKEKFTDIRDEDITYLGDDWFFIAPLRHNVGFIALQMKVSGTKFKITGFKVPEP
jgi:hypothetical protein